MERERGGHRQKLHLSKQRFHKINITRNHKFQFKRIDFYAFSPQTERNGTHGSKIYEYIYTQIECVYLVEFDVKYSYYANKFGGQFTKRSAFVHFFSLLGQRTVTGWNMLFVARQIKIKYHSVSTLKFSHDLAIKIIIKRRMNRNNAGVYPHEICTAQYKHRLRVNYIATSSVQAEAAIASL